MIDSKYIGFQTDLQNGMTITEALQKHDLCFCDAFNTLHNHGPKQIKRRRVDRKNRYLLVRKGRAQVRKKIKGHDYCFGSYGNIQDARKVRNWLEKHNWVCDDLDALCEELGVYRSKVAGRQSKCSS